MMGLAAVGVRQPMLLLANLLLAISLKIFPQAGFAPLKIAAQAFITEHKDNQELHLDVYCDSMWVDGSSRDLRIHHPPYTFKFTLRESCTYTITATVLGLNGRAESASQTVIVR